MISRNSGTAKLTLSAISKSRGSRASRQGNLVSGCITLHKIWLCRVLVMGETKTIGQMWQNRCKMCWVDLFLWFIHHFINLFTFGGFRMNHSLRIFILYVSFFSVHSELALDWETSELIILLILVRSSFINFICI